MATLGHVMVVALAAVNVGGLTTDECLTCICMAVSGCDIQRGCLGGSCGPFDIPRDQWIDAGSPVQYRDDPREKEAFQRCVLEPFCAVETVLRYTNKYAKDCDGDGKVTCMDLFMVHLQGTECSFHLLSSKHKQNILSCLKGNGSYEMSGPQENNNAPVVPIPTPTTSKPRHPSTPSTKMSTKSAFTTPIYVYPTKQSTDQAYRTPPTPVYTNKPTTKSQGIISPSRTTPKPVHTTPRSHGTMKTTPKTTNGTRQASTNVRTLTRNNTVNEMSVLNS